MSKIRLFCLLAMLGFLLIAPGSLTGCSCKDDDDDDGGDDDDCDDDTSDDDDNDDAGDDDDDDDDDDDTDDTETIILDDGVSDGGISGPEIGSILAQGFSPSNYPVTLESATVHVGSAGITGQVEMVVYYQSTKGEPPITPVYTSDPFTFANAWDWNDFDLSGATELQNNPITAGEFWVGFRCLESACPSLSYDPDGEPDNNIWRFDPIASAWENLVDIGLLTGGVLMIRPTVRNVPE